MSLNEKHIRSINWDEEEKQLFRSVLKEFATTIENKSLDDNVNKLKTKAWEEIHKKFNELNGRLRSLKQLKIQWKTMKINARKEVSLFKRATNKTDGGGRPQTPTNDVIEINELLNPAELLRDENIYDSDGIIISASTSKDVNASETCILTLEDITENIVKSDLAEKWDTALRIGKPISPAMRVCSHHFQASNYFPNNSKRQKLFPNVVPSQNIPKSSSDKVVPLAQKIKSIAQENIADIRHRKIVDPRKTLDWLLRMKKLSLRMDLRTKI
ncbi:unnamed protein product [Euphydryas editha]|uniref:Regulatory protein zeste n=1 Tax=Euphydryas editha TaxID=104508 RepID=A0AAU9UN95_EUPED|nr:unnamed protein product [Euphydryas editha]